MRRVTLTLSSACLIQACIIFFSSAPAKVARISSLTTCTRKWVTCHPAIHRTWHSIVPSCGGDGSWRELGWKAAPQQLRATWAVCTSWWDFIRLGPSGPTIGKGQGQTPGTTWITWGPNHGACGTRAEERATNLVTEATVIWCNLFRQTGHIDPVRPFWMCCRVHAKPVPRCQYLSTASHGNHLRKWWGNRSSAMHFANLCNAVGSSLSFRLSPAFDATQTTPIKSQKSVWRNLDVSENSAPLKPMVNDHYPVFKWLFHWEYTQHFQTNPRVDCFLQEYLWYLVWACHAAASRVRSQWTSAQFRYLCLCPSSM